MFQILAVVSLLCLTSRASEDVDMSNIGYDPGQLLSKILPANFTQPRVLIKFEEQFDEQGTTPGPKPIKFGPDQETYGYGNEHVKFVNEDQKIVENGINNSVGSGFQYGDTINSQKKRRRRRKPRQQFPGQPPYLNPGYPGYPGPVGPSSGIAPGFGPELQPGFSGQFYGPPPRPRPSPASDVLSAVTGALASVAQNDERQCVARLLCEAASGGALGAGLLDSVSGLQPLLTLLSAYNGISSHPLFVFGGAAFLGLSSKGNPGSCRYAYPLCPTDPEQLVHYLNNHNGGFFRFFNAPQRDPQKLEQFYNQLSQNYGLLQPSPELNQEYYGLLNTGQHPNPSQQNLYPNGYQQSYGFAYPHDQNFNGNGIRFKNERDINENRIEKRIQNKPSSFLNDNSDVNNSKWLFPGDDDESDIGIQNDNYDNFKDTANIKGKALRFPDSSIYNNDSDQEYGPNSHYAEHSRKPKEISFPKNEYNNHSYRYNTNNYNSVNSDKGNNNYNSVYSDKGNNNYNGVYSDKGNNNYNIVYSDKGNNNYNNVYSVKGTNNYNSVYSDKVNNNNYNNDEPGVTTVYVIRGNGDPNKPEIVKLRPGETL